jgi:hypothetical protein
MPLMTCSDCEKRHSDEAPACPQCGRPNMMAPVVATVPLLEGRYPQAPIGPRLACPACGSPDVKKLSLVYREGTTHLQMNLGLATHTLGGAVIGTPARGSSRSLLSLHSAPPAKKEIGAGHLLAVGIAAILLVIASGGGGSGFLVVGALILTALGAAAVQAQRWNREEFPKLYAHWDATFLCTRCENRFIP